MKKAMNKILLVSAGALSLLALSGCTSIWDLITGGGSASSELLQSTKTGATYGAVERAADSSGTNYSSSSSKYTYRELGEAGGDYYLNSVGTYNLLVIPVAIRDYSSNATETVRNNIYTTFFGDSSDTGWESLASFYYKSSFGKLLLNGTVSGFYDCGYSPKELAALAENANNPTGYDPTWSVLEGAVSWYKKTYNSSCSEFDNDHDGLIDGVWLVYDAPYAQSTNTLDQNLFWAYTFADYSLEKTSLSSPMAFRYSWASFNFMYEGYGKDSLDAHTFIHETGHLLGLDDYYVSKSVSNTKNYGAMGGVDMMDCNVIDHDAFSKFALGWIDPFLVSGTTTITLKPAATSGEAVLLPTGDGWNGSAFDEYMLLEYYTPTNLNEKDAAAAYSNGVRGFTENGVRIYHVDARMAKVSISGSKASYSYTDEIIPLSSSQGTLAAHSNSNYYNYIDTNDRLIQEMDCTNKRNFDTSYDALQKQPLIAGNSTLFQAGDSFSFASYKNSFPNYYYHQSSTMNDGTEFPFSVSFSNMSDSSITLTITKA